MEQWIADNTGTILTALGMVIAFIVGYVKLQQKSKTNANDISQIKISCITCKSSMQDKFKQINGEMNKNIQKIHDQISQIKNTIASISGELNKISGILQTYMKYFSNSNNKKE